MLLGLDVTRFGKSNFCERGAKKLVNQHAEKYNVADDDTAFADFHGGD